MLQRGAAAALFVKWSLCKICSRALKKKNASQIVHIWRRLYLHALPQKYYLPQNSNIHSSYTEFTWFRNYLKVRCSLVHSSCIYMHTAQLLIPDVAPQSIKRREKCLLYQKSISGALEIKHTVKTGVFAWAGFQWKYHMLPNAILALARTDGCF